MWVSHAFHLSASTVHSSDQFRQLHSCVHSRSCPGGGIVGLGSEGSCGTGKSVSRILLMDVCCSESLGSLASHHRLVSSKQVCDGDKVQDGNSSVCSGFHSSRGLDVFHRLEESYLQIPMHPESRKYLRFVTSKGVFQFRVLCFGLTTDPQVFTRAPVSVILHSLGIRILRYLNYWLILASSRENV